MTTNINILNFTLKDSATTVFLLVAVEADPEAIELDDASGAEDGVTLNSPDAADASNGDA
ncbi:hypothetical protein LXA43DRAFT_1091795 [Ganoderma leucocontextum]|nr:hypothetical protein LXA43DRAFT_1091795 [Ganoderma leucocontextum]